VQFGVEQMLGSRVRQERMFRGEREGLTSGERASLGSRRDEIFLKMKSF
jgi:hypothetical protein